MNRSELESQTINQLKDLAYEQGFTREDALPFGDTRRKDTWINLILSGKKPEPVISEESEVSSDYLDDLANENEELRLLDVEGYRSVQKFTVITLWQPWATFLARGIKVYETRSWGTNHRGKILIHAAKRPINWNEINVAELEKYYPDIKNWDYPLGAIVCQMELVNCRQMTEEVEYNHQHLSSYIYLNDPLISPLERLVGNWQKGRFAWKLRYPTPLLIPNVAGKQGLWNLTISDSKTEPKLSQDDSTCPYCDGTGYVGANLCPCSFKPSPEAKPSQDANSQGCLTCEGKPVYRCRHCEGSGEVVDPEILGQQVFDCPRCNGRGYRNHHELENREWFTQIRCPMCGEKPIQDVMNTEESPVKTNNPPICSYCDGEGVIDKLFTDDYGQEDYKTVTCPNCHGSGSPHPDSSLEAPNPEIYLNFEAFKAAYEDWRERLWGGDFVLDDEVDIAQVEEQFTTAEELWEQQEKVAPFSNSSEFGIFWQSNCHVCDKHRPDQCEISDSLLEACLSDGLIRKNIFNRMGSRSGKCAEFTPRKNESEWLGGVFVGASNLGGNNAG